ncbi:MAG: FHA domain-containing protein [Bryobacterales bacterium]|nr:FHA domain-containing protein [Bryobacterales bacterium]
MAPTQQAVPGIPRELIIRDSEGKVTYLPLDDDRILLGRSSTCQLCYPNDSGLSRQHMALTRVDGNRWQVEDLGSKNGTLLNEQKIEGVMPVVIGDQIAAGHLTLELAESIPDAQRFEKVEFVDESKTHIASSTTVVAKLDSLLNTQPGDLDKTSIIQTNPQMQALIRAGRELAEHRPLNELFEVIMDLSMEAVMAGRGVLMTLEGGELLTKAQRGAGFKISSTVRDRVLKEKASLLVRDAMRDQALKEQKSIVQQRVRGMIAVPLQTNDRVIGLIYVDSPDMIREFTKEDLGLLTVMANVAAIRIEHVRLLEIELTERAMAKELEQAAHIQMGLLPSKPPNVEGLDIAGNTAPCHTVGGDYYDYLEFPDGRIAMLVGDVAGKGMPASLLMSSLQARVKVLFEEGDRLSEKITRLNKTTTASTPDNRFITFLHDGGGPPDGRAGVHQRGSQSALVGPQVRRLRAAGRRRHDPGHSAHGAIYRVARTDAARRYAGAVQRRRHRSRQSRR